MNEVLTKLYRVSRPKEALASQDECKSANALLGSDVDKFAKAIICECARILEEDDGATPNGELLFEHFGVEE